MSETNEKHNIKYYREKANELSSELYPTIGEFVVSFESVCHGMKSGIDVFLQDNGLRNSSRLSDILVGDLTAFPLVNVYRSIVIETQKPNVDEVKIIDNIVKRIIELAEERNRIVHSAWFIDYKSMEDLEKGLLIQYRPGASKQGAKESPTRYPIKNIKDFITKARTLHVLVEELNMCVYQGTKIDNRFMLNKNGEVLSRGSYFDSIEKSSTQKPVCVVIPRKRSFGHADSST